MQPIFMEEDLNNTEGDKMLQILVVEDDISLNQGMILALKSEEYEFYACYSLAEARAMIQKGFIDLILLDLNLPDGNGLDLLKQIRKKSQIPVILLTARDMEADEVMGLELGADDYITKPFSLMVLRARIRKVIQRMSKENHMSEYKNGGYRFFFETMKFYCEELEVILSKTEQKLLYLLIKNEGITLTREFLTDHIWSDGAEYVDENALSVTVKRLRDKLQRKKIELQPIHTIYGIGYVWRMKE